MCGVESSPHLPESNSYYEGSPYKKENSMIILRVGQDWDPSVVTWLTQPKVHSKDTVVIPKSDKQWNYDANVDVTTMVKAMIANPANN